MEDVVDAVHGRLDRHRGARAAAPDGGHARRTRRGRRGGRVRDGHAPRGVDASCSPEALDPRRWPAVRRWRLCCPVRSAPAPASPSPSPSCTASARTEPCRATHRARRSRPRGSRASRQSWRSRPCRRSRSCAIPSTIAVGSRVLGALPWELVLIALSLVILERLRRGGAAVVEICRRDRGAEPVAVRVPGRVPRRLRRARGEGGRAPVCAGPGAGASVGDARVPGGASARRPAAAHDAPDRRHGAVSRAVHPGRDRGSLDGDDGRREGRASTSGATYRHASTTTTRRRAGSRFHSPASCDDPRRRAPRRRPVRPAGHRHRDLRLRPPSGTLVLLGAARRPRWTGSRGRPTEPCRSLVASAPKAYPGLPSRSTRRTVPIEIVGRADAFPGMTSLRRPLVVVDAERLARSVRGRQRNPLNGSGASDELWIRGIPPSSRDALAGLELPAEPHPHRRRGQGHRVHRGRHRHVPRDERARGSLAILLVFAAMLMYLQTRQRSEIVSYGLSLRMGMRSSRHLLAIASRSARCS